MHTFRTLCIWIMSGAVILSGCQSGNRISKRAVGTNSGVATGAIIAQKTDKQKQELEAIFPADVIIESIHNGEALIVIFDSGRLFAANSNTISEASKSTLRQFAANLNNYPDTNIRITSHTDNTGRADYNQTLSERRAGSVYDYLRDQGVDAKRMDYVGKGIHEPVADNNTAEGRALNRRIEIRIERRNGTITSP